MENNSETKNELLTSVNAVEVDDKEVARLASIEELATLGDGTAAFNASVMRARGVGCEPNRELALKWLKKSADAGVPRAQGQLAYMYASGRGGVPKDKAMAKHWYSLAAQGGDAESLYRLGNIYHNGSEADPIMAGHYWSRAAQLGHPKALERIRSLAPEPPIEYTTELQRPQHARVFARIAKRVLCCYACFGIKHPSAPADHPKPTSSPLVEPLMPEQDDGHHFNNHPTDPHENEEEHSREDIDRSNESL
eukprot:CAMPEP_0197287742 /NCGR_PEP_ID=MMETSP0890-20130614/4396_1 /TAXON_ID=44058 ORGANISM="Aureoumbra lagunensis, Strain CCMP1510" /NCGR_SAMPLE_ID=MMETSP0890 /ASSEMBLY_ACC=CAM_ASM_000533 /LENGTH=250 /DNA_ID=CAMNT_0042757781 /DNA_START=18 /DNA_END=770 /DNA_ORIENTATION=-